LHNLRQPVTFANDLLQANFERAGETLGSFVVNSTIGILGFFDAAGVPPHDEDFGQTLAIWNLRDGPYLVLPLFGPSTVRDAPARVSDVQPMIRDLFTRLRTVLLATVLAVAATSAHAATTDVALAFVTDLGGEAVRIVSDPALKTAEFETKFRAFIDRGFD